MIADQLRTIAARLVLSPESQIDGRMILALAESVAAIESDNAEVHEKAGAVLLALNDLTNGMQELANQLARRKPLSVDGVPIDGRTLYDHIKPDA